MLLIAINPVGHYHARSIRKMKNAHTAFEPRLAHESPVYFSSPLRSGATQPCSCFSGLKVLGARVFAMGSVRELLRPSGNLDHAGAPAISLSTLRHIGSPVTRARARAALLRGLSNRTQMFQVDLLSSHEYGQ